MIKKITKEELNRRRNKGIKSEIKSLTKNFINSTKIDSNILTEKNLRKVQSALDKSKIKGVFHKRKVARKMSMISKMNNAKLVQKEK